MSRNNLVKWTDCLLGDLFARRSERGIDGLATLSVTLNDGLIERSELERKNETNLTPEQHLLVRKGDIAYNMMRMWQGASGLAEVDGITSPAYIVLQPKDGIDSRFAAHWFKSHEMINLFRLYSHGLTKDRLRLYFDDFAQIPVSVPSLSEQRQIAAILSTWDRAIDQTQRLLDASKRRKQALMQKLLTGAWRFSEFGKPAKNGELPKGWFEVILGNLGGTYAGLSGKSKKDFGQGKPYIPYLNIFSNTSIDKSQVDYVQIHSNEKQNPVRYGDIFFTTSSETPDEVGMSSVLLFHPASAMYLNSFCFGFRLHDFSLVLPEFAAFLFRGNEFRSSIFALAQGATRYNLSKTQLLQLSCTLPPLPEQEKIAAVLTTADNEITTLRKSLEQLQLQKRGLMQKLLTGEIRV